MENTRADLVRLITAYAESTGRTIATVSRLASGSGVTIARLSRGDNITVRRIARIAQWLSDHWPLEASWPADIPRPTPIPGRRE